MIVCHTPNCGTPAKCKGLCQKCYDRARKTIRNAAWSKRLVADRVRRKGLCSFYKCHNKPDQPYKRCRFHRRAANRNRQTYLKTHPDYQKSSTHERRYHEPYQNKLDRIEKQNQKCAACGTPNPGKRGWQTDHDHKTGKIRGELCGPCNRILGHAQDDPSILQKLIIYVMTPRD